MADDVGTHYDGDGCEPPHESGSMCWLNGEPFPIEYDENWARDLEQGFEAYMFRLLDGIDSEEGAQTISGVSFCGCDTCITRETLAYLIPKILDGNQKGLVQPKPPLRLVSD